MKTSATALRASFELNMGGTGPRSGRGGSSAHGSQLSPSIAPPLDAPASARSSRARPSHSCASASSAESSFPPNCDSTCSACSSVASSCRAFCRKVISAADVDAENAVTPTDESAAETACPMRPAVEECAFFSSGGTR
eukprot:3979490-Prymnesium_polylepis.1